MNVQTIDMKFYKIKLLLNSEQTINKQTTFRNLVSHQFIARSQWPHNPRVQFSLTYGQFARIDYYTTYKDQDNDDCLHQPTLGDKLGKQFTPAATITHHKRYRTDRKLRLRKAVLITRISSVLVECPRTFVLRILNTIPGRTFRGIQRK